MSIWLGVTAVVTKSLTGVASAAAGILTSVIIKFPFFRGWLQEGEDDSWIDTLIDIIASFLEFVQFLREEGWGALTNPQAVISFLIKEDLAVWIDRNLGKLLNDPGLTQDILVVVFGFVALAGLTLLMLKLNAYVLKIGVYSFDYTPEQIYEGETGLTSPYYYPLRFGVALAVIACAPVIFAALWHIMHHFIIADFVRATYGTTTIGETTAEIILSLLDGKTLVWMWITSPLYVSLIIIFLLVYAVLHLAVVFAWAWMIWRTAQYGDGENTKEVITDTGSWALGLLAIMGLTKTLVWLTPLAVNAMDLFVDLATAFSAWFLFLIAFPFVTAYLVWKTFGKLRQFTVRHILQIQPPKYQATAGVLTSATTRTIGGLRQTYTRAGKTLSSGVAYARRLTGV